MVSSLTYLDIGVLVLLFIFFLIGIKNGFLNSILGLIGVIVSLVAAIYFAGRVANLLNPLIGQPINNWVNGLLVKMLNPNSDPNNMFEIAIGSQDKIAVLVAEALAKLGLPEVITNSLNVSITNAIVAAVSTNASALAENSIIDIFTPIVGKLFLLIISGILLFIAIRIVVAVLEAIVNAILRTSRTLRRLDRLLGSVLGLVKGMIVVLIIFTLSTFILSGTVPDAESKDLKTQIRTAIDESDISRYIYENNPIPGYISENVDFNQIISNLFNKNKEQEEEVPEETTSPIPSPGEQAFIR